MTQPKRMSAEREVELDAIVDAIDDHATDPAERALCDAWTEVRALRAERDEARREAIRMVREQRAIADHHERCRMDATARADRAEAERDALAAQLGACRDLIKFIVQTNEQAPRDPRYETYVENVCGGVGYGALMSAARHMWADMLRREGIEGGAHCIAPALPVLKAALRDPATAAAERDARLRAEGARAALTDAADAFPVSDVFDVHGRGGVRDIEAVCDWLHGLALLGADALAKGTP